MPPGLHSFLEALGEDPFLWRFWGFVRLARGLPHSSVPVPILLFSKPAIEGQSFTEHITPILSLPSFSPFKKPCDYIGPTQIIQNNFPIKYHLISNLNSPLPLNITSSQVLGMRTGTFLFCSPQSWTKEARPYHHRDCSLVGWEGDAGKTGEQIAKWMIFSSDDNWEKINQLLEYDSQGGITGEMTLNLRFEGGDLCHVNCRQVIARKGQEREMKNSFPRSRNYSSKFKKQKKGLACLINHRESMELQYYDGLADGGRW